MVGYELFNSAVNGGEVVGMTPKQLCDAIKAGEVLGMTADMKLDEAKGFHAIMVKTGIGNLVSTDQSAVANLMYTVYKREGENFKVISSRFGRQTIVESIISQLTDN